MNLAGYSEKAFILRNWEKEYVYSNICGFVTVSILQIYANIHNIKEEKKGKVEGSREDVISFSEVVLIQNKLSC